MDNEDKGEFSEEVLFGSQISQTNKKLIQLCIEELPGSRQSSPQSPDQGKPSLAMEELKQFFKTRDGGSSVQKALELSTLDLSSEPNESVGSTINDKIVIRGLKLQEMNNIILAAYKEIMTLAFNARTWVLGTPAVGSIEEFLQMFRSSPQPGMRVEHSIESAIVPTDPETLVSLMMDERDFLKNDELYKNVFAGYHTTSCLPLDDFSRNAKDIWHLYLSPVVHRGSEDVPIGDLQQLAISCPCILKTVMVNADFQLPTPFVPSRKFSFLRCQKEIIEDIWAIIDVSKDYFEDTPSYSTMENKCRRRPSGMIIRGREEHSEVIWIENVEVYEFQDQDNIYSNRVNSNQAFCAKHLVSTLSRKLKRRNSKFFMNLKMQLLDQQASVYLMVLADYMEECFMECVNEAPNESKWILLSEQGVRILRNRTANHGHTHGSNNYVALTSLRVQAKPFTVFQFLVGKSLELQWPSLPNQGEPEEIVKSYKQEASNCITLYRKLVAENESEKSFTYMLQETSRDEFCSMIVSLPLTNTEINDALSFGLFEIDSLKPSGFAIIPDGSGGLQSDTSLVTVVIQRELAISKSNEAIEAMRSLINTIHEEIIEAVTSTGGAQS